MFGHDDSNQQQNTDANPGSAPAVPGSFSPAPSPFALPSDNAAPAKDADDAVDNELNLPNFAASGSGPTPAVDPPVNSDNTDLAKIKQDALQQLTPLVGHLDQSPEEKFRTTMMMIQATDDQSLIPDAYQAAQSITDEKAKAQALLDVVNEINYFTQHKS